MLFSTHVLFLDFHLSFVFHVFKHLIPNGIFVCFQHLSASQVWIRSASWISKKSMRSWNRCCWLCMFEQFFVFFVVRSSSDIARFKSSCKCCQVAMKLIDMDPISKLQTFAWLHVGVKSQTLLG